MLHTETALNLGTKEEGVSGMYGSIWDNWWLSVFLKQLHKNCMGSHLFLIIKWFGVWGNLHWCSADITLDQRFYYCSGYTFQRCSRTNSLTRNNQWPSRDTVLSSSWVSFITHDSRQLQTKVNQEQQFKRSQSVAFCVYICTFAASTCGKISLISPWHLNIKQRQIFRGFKEIWIWIHCFLKDVQTMRQSPGSWLKPNPVRSALLRKAALFFSQTYGKKLQVSPPSDICPLAVINRLLTQSTAWGFDLA